MQRSGHAKPTSATVASEGARSGAVQGKARLMVRIPNNKQDQKRPPARPQTKNHENPKGNGSPNPQPPNPNKQKKHGEPNHGERKHRHPSTISSAANTSQKSTSSKLSKDSKYTKSHISTVKTAQYKKSMMHCRIAPW